MPISQHKRLELLRKKIDVFDKKIMTLLVRRFDVVDLIGSLKRENSIPYVDKKREKEILSKSLKFSQKYGRFLKRIYREIIRSSREIQR